MQDKKKSFLLIAIFIFIFIVLYKGLNNSSLFVPTKSLEDIPEFKVKTFFKKETINSKYIFDKKKFYLLNIWSSWCVPCKEEHKFLMKLKRNNKLEIIGLNYKDNINNAEKFILEMGNPYTMILIDRDGTKAIEWGAYGVPESFLIYENKILKRYVGPLNLELNKEIENFLK